ncbi:hypothetical protein C8R43DRAFT_958810 [Mycena crocata]|nr:hypothetical protein C8R43DRAFT_958810 [Mycena crocata]
MSREPTLPPELERRIFELATHLYPQEAPTLLRIARRVFHWIGPLLYNVVKLGPGRAFPSLPTNLKSAYSLHNAVRHVMLADVHAWRQTGTGTGPEIAARSLRLFKGLEDFTALGAVRPINLLEIFSGIQLRRLSMDLEGLFNFKAIDLTLPLFSTLTHLDVFDKDYPEDGRKWADLATLPNLTHLCFQDWVSGAMLRMILSTCARLHVFVNRWSHRRAPAARSVAARPPVTDPRFVMLFVGDYSAEWEIGARGGEDFWVRASRFLAQKRNGEVQASCFLIDLPILVMPDW